MELNFKQIAKSEAEILANWLSSDRWPYFLGHTPSKEDVMKRIEDGAFFGDSDINFWIQGHDDQPIGLIEIYQLDDLAPMFSIRLRSDFRGQGLGKPTLDWLTAHIFKSYPEILRIEGQTREDNIPMRKVFNKCGYVKEAYYRLASPTEDGGRVASIAYGILRSDWQTGKITPVEWEKDKFFAADRKAL